MEFRASQKAQLPVSTPGRFPPRRSAIQRIMQAHQGASLVATHLESAWAVMYALAQPLLVLAPAVWTGLGRLDPPRLHLVILDTSFFRFVSNHREERGGSRAQDLPVQSFLAGSARCGHGLDAQLLGGDQRAPFDELGALLVQEVLASPYYLASQASHAGPLLSPVLRPSLLARQRALLMRQLVELASQKARVLDRLSPPLLVDERGEGGDPPVHPERLAPRCALGGAGDGHRRIPVALPVQDLTDLDLTPLPHPAPRLERADARETKGAVVPIGEDAKAIAVGGVAPPLETPTRLEAREPWCLPCLEAPEEGLERKVEAAAA